MNSIRVERIDGNSVSSHPEGTTTLSQALNAYRRFAGFENNSDALGQEAAVNIVL